VYSRADRWRTVVIVAPFLTAVSADAAAREFRAANARAVE
jgi:hypothetical protein